MLDKHLGDFNIDAMLYLQQIITRQAHSNPNITGF